MVTIGSTVVFVATYMDGDINSQRLWLLSFNPFRAGDATLVYEFPPIAFPNNAPYAPSVA
jgi:hypothetical protein